MCLWHVYLHVWLLFEIFTCLRHYLTYLCVCGIMQPNYMSEYHLTYLHVHDIFDKHIFLWHVLTYLHVWDFGFGTLGRLPVLKDLLIVSGVSGTLIPAIISESRLVRESLQEPRYLSLLGVAETRHEKYLSCSILEVVSLPAVPEIKHEKYLSCSLI